MVKVKERDYILPDGTINIQAWLHEVAEKRLSHGTKLIAQACQLSQLVSGNKILVSKQSCLQQGLKMAELLLDLHVDPQAVAAAILYNNVEYGVLSLDDITEQLNFNVARLIAGTQRMEAIHALISHPQHPKTQSRSQVDNLRKMLLAMVEDVRVVLIKLAERVCLIHAASKLDTPLQQHIAWETINIYAPLANRLGIGQIKWELEDLSLRYLEPKAYKEIAKLLASRRVDREAYIQEVIRIIENELAKAGLKHFEIAGRAKHIYSIYRKMKRKDVGYDKIYDVSAVRVLVPKLEDCYTVLSAVHGLWPHIAEEFDDYIANPKPNGYRSLHTAVTGPHGKNLEVQIRTYDMHQESELGVAAHWKYKEGGPSKGDYEDKIAWLRQVLEWQQELTQEGKPLEQTDAQHIFEDRVYVFTPQGQIIDLPQGSTPLDFAYHIHSEVGNRCRGAKVNGHIVPLTYPLRTGERAEILTARNATPSRDWLNPQSGYLKTARGRAKVHHWFKQQEQERYHQEGQALLEQEVKKLQQEGASSRIHYDKIAKRFNFRTSHELFVAIAHGDVKLGQVMHSIKQALGLDKPPVTEHPVVNQAAVNANAEVSLKEYSDLLSYHAKCCKPVPGDPIIGYITKGRGISIHRKDCSNIRNMPHQERLLKVDWSEQQQQHYPVDITILARERQGLLNDTLTILTNEKIPLLSLNTHTKRNDYLTTIALTVEVSRLERIHHLIARLKQLPEVLEVSRYQQG